jgi:hypothetical protein
MAAKVLVAAAVVAAALVAAAVLWRDSGEGARASQSEVAVTSERDLFELTVSPTPAHAPVNRLHTWRLTLRTADGEAVTGARITVDGDMPAHGHGLPTVPQVRELGDGAYVVEGMKFQMGGKWYVEFRVTSPRGDDVARIDFTLPGGS